MGIEIRLAQTKSENENAYTLAKSVFLDGASGTAEKLKMISWHQVEQNILTIATDGQRVVALARICPSLIKWKSKQFNVAGLTSICVDSGYRGMGIGRQIMNTAVEYCDIYGYDFTYLIARKSADYFYQKFDYTGASSYPRITINEYKKDMVARPNIISDLELSPFNKKNCWRYHDFYLSNYEDCFGATLRNTNLWANIEKRLPLLGLAFHEIWYQHTLVGYGIADNQGIVEYAVDLDLPEQLISASFGLMIKNKNSIELGIPHHHRLVPKLASHDLVFTSRRCLYGGHMLRWNKHSKIKIEFNIGTTDPQTVAHPFFSINRLDEL
jgi:predicted acetyltransferase